MVSKAPPGHLAYMVDHLNVGVFVVGRDYKVQLWNRFMATHSGHGADEVVGRDLFECFPDLPSGWLKKKIDSVFTLKTFAFTSWQQRPYLFRFSHSRPMTGEVETMYQDCTLIPVTDGEGEVSAVCVTVIDATDAAIFQVRLNEAYRKLEASSRLDGLTQLYNRYYWEGRLAEEFARTRRHGGALSLILLDLDHFKATNDSYGHPSGDAVLCEVARLMQATLRENDVACRYGGEEFAVLLPDTDGAGACRVAERLRKLIEDTTVSTPHGEIRVTASFGVAEYLSGVTQQDVLIRRADEALYEAKRRGRNCWVCWTGVVAENGTDGG